MLSVLKPNESIYDITKFYRKISRINLLKQKKNILNKISLPKLPNSKKSGKDLAKSLSISGKNNFKIHKINLNYTKNFENNLSDITNHNIFENKQVLSENNIKLPEVYKKKNYFSENNSPIKNKNDEHFLYLKYEGDDNNINEIKNKIYIKIYPHKIIHSLKNIINNNEILINNLEQKINKIMVDKYTTMTNLNRFSTTYFKTIDVDYNEILNNAEKKYILLTENNKNPQKHIFRIKNVFLENIIKNTITHTVEVVNKKNQIMLKEDLEDELNYQLDLLKKFFINAINNRKTDKTEKTQKENKFIKIKKYLLKSFNNNIFQNFDETRNITNCFINKRTEGYLTERNNKNKEIFNLFKKQLDMTKYQSIHNLYNNIVTYNHNNISQNKIILEDKKTNTENESNKIKKINNNLNNKKSGLLYFYMNYQEIKDDLNLNNIKKGNYNNEYIFDLGPNLKFVEFDEIIDEINNINIHKKNNITKSINNEAIFLKMLSEKSILNKIKFNHVKNKNIPKLFKDNISSRRSIFIKSKLSSNIDILKKLGNKLHKKIKIKIGRNKKYEKLNSSFETNKTEYIEKSKKEKFTKDSLLTENYQINTETNSSVFSDIPSDFSMSYSEIKKEKEEKTKKIRQIAQNKEFYDESNILDIDELFFNIKKNKNKEENMINKEEDSKENIKIKEKDLPIKKEDDKDNNKEKEFIKIEDNKKINVEKNINITNIFIKNKIKKRQIKKIHINDEKEQIKSKFSNNTNITNKTLINKEHTKTNISKDKQKSKEVINKKDNNLQNMTNKSIKSNKKEIQNNENNESNLIKKEEIEQIKNIEKIRINSQRKNKNEKSINRKRFKSEKQLTSKKAHKKRNKSKIKEFDIEGSTDKGSFRYNYKDDIDKNKNLYEELMNFFNDKYNIPGKNNKIKIKKILYKSFSQKLNYNLSSNTSFSEEYYSIHKTKTNIYNEIDKDQLIINKSFSFIETRNDKKLILLRSLLNHILHKKNTNTKQIKDSINKLFSSSGIKTINRTPYKYDMKKKRKMSFDYYGNNVSKRNHRLLMEKYFSSGVKIPPKRYKDDNDISLNFSKNFMRNKVFKKKINKKKGFKDFLNNYDIYESNQLWIEKFENNKRENEIIRNIIESKREMKRKNVEESEKEFNNFKSYINNLKKMTEEQFKYDAIGFIFKIKSDLDKYQLSNKVKRINEFKKFLKTNEINKLNNNKSILKNVLFQSNCIFCTDKNF